MNRKIIFLVLIIGIILIGAGYIILQPFYFYTEIQYEGVNFFNRNDMDGCGNRLHRVKRDFGDSFVINSQDEYKKLQSDTMEFFNCKWNTEPPKIDFSQKTLLGKFEQGTGCSTEFKRKVYQDDSDKKIIYYLNIVERGGCEKWVGGRRWIIIPKIPSDYSVEFVEKYSRSRW